MKQQLANAALPLAIGIVLFLAMRAGLAALATSTSDAPPFWLMSVTTVLVALTRVLPGIVVGYLAKSSSALLGFLAYFIGSLATSLFLEEASSFFGPSEKFAQSIQAVAAATGSGLVGMCAAAFGRFILRK